MLLVTPECLRETPASDKLYLKFINNYRVSLVGNVAFKSNLYNEFIKYLSIET